jgi:hypothetical protein
LTAEERKFGLSIFLTAGHIPQALVLSDKGIAIALGRYSGAACNGLFEHSKTGFSVEQWICSLIKHTRLRMKSQLIFKILEMVLCGEKILVTFDDMWKFCV